MCIRDRASDMISKEKFDYNENIMLALLEANFIENVLLTNDKPSLFPKFLTHLVKWTSSPDIKIGVCRYIYKALGKVKDQGNLDIYRTSYKQLSAVLIDLFMMPNAAIASLAAEALKALCEAFKEIKPQLVHEGVDRICFKNLGTRMQTLLKHTLALLDTLLSASQNLEHFLKNGLLDKLKGMLEGMKGEDSVYSDETLIYLFVICARISATSEKNCFWLIERMDNMMSVFLGPRPSGDTPSEELRWQCLGLLMCLLEYSDGNEKAKKEIALKIGDALVGLVLDKPKPMTNDNLKGVVLGMMSALRDNVEFIKKMKEANILDAIKKYKKDERLKPLVDNLTYTLREKKKKEDDKDQSREYYL
eukprot:TRINITY_DN9206_c0_g2_i1.p1 TRINITY_DN9206_c0_g2~~TRINITY_DN9206_c0_g2_i1.p1  ORF type:complete len:362 (-),score=88.01 TRINITY_DN9206_c0_g2_i1:247-1332(-)